MIYIILEAMIYSSSYIWSEYKFNDGLRYVKQNLVEYKVTMFVGVPLLMDSIYKGVMKEIEKQGKTKLIKIATPITNFLLKLGIDVRRKVYKKAYRKSYYKYVK